MTSSQSPPSGLPPSMGPGARPLQPGERPGGLLQEITEIRSHYNVHIAPDAIELGYELKGQHRHYRLPYDNMPVGSWTKALCFGGRNSGEITGTLLVDLIRGSENASGRPITQEEAEGIAFYGSRRMMIMYVGQVASIGMGLGSAWMGRKDMKFPFRAPKPAERYESFPMRVLPILKGRHAKVMWHITRANIYIFMWLLLANPLFRSVADTRMTVGLYSDRRTRNLTKDLKGNLDRLHANRARAAASRIQPPAQKSDTSENMDDASPTTLYDRQQDGYQSDAAGDSTFTDGRTDSGLISDTTLQQRQTTQASPNPWSKAQSKGSRQSYEQPQPSSASSDFFFDDASPTAGNDPDMDTSKPYVRQPPGSAWSRVRKDGSEQSTGTRRWTGPRTQDFETKSDNFSFSDTEEEKRLAKQQAQKEFDAILEKERRQGGSGDYARDMQATASGEDPSSGRGNAWSWRRG